MTEGELQEALVRMNAFNEELRKAGVMRDCDRLQPSKEGNAWSAGVGPTLMSFDGQTR